MKNALIYTTASLAGLLIWLGIPLMVAFLPIDNMMVVFAITFAWGVIGLPLALLFAVWFITTNAR